MPTPALYQHHNITVCCRYNSASLLKLRGCPASLSRLQAVPTRHKTRAQVLVYGCAQSAKGPSSQTGSQHQDGHVLRPHGSLTPSQAGNDRRPILSGGGGGIFFFWQLGIHLSLLHALGVPTFPLPYQLHYLHEGCHASQA